jgi:hypothetical protein
MTSLEPPLLHNCESPIFDSAPCPEAHAILETDRSSQWVFGEPKISGGSWSFEYGVWAFHFLAGGWGKHLARKWGSK